MILRYGSIRDIWTSLPENTSSSGETPRGSTVDAVRWEVSPRNSPLRRVGSLNQGTHLILPISSIGPTVTTILSRYYDLITILTTCHQAVQVVLLQQDSSWNWGRAGSPREV